MSGFKAFILRGNLVDLAVAFVMGVAFAALVQAFIKDLITPILAAIGGKPNFAGLSFTINHSNFLYGDFINALISFVVIAAVIYYFVVVPYGRLMTRYGRQQPAAEKNCPYCAMAIPVPATRCPSCTSQLTDAVPSSAV
ncbi:MAG TPA: large conductance mechanosensitive channel protein MscL [Chloroflexota bacterium]|nr:large conductance mechanosensitive channel protein MscL [Chloroflexota bacterium]